MKLNSRPQVRYVELDGERGLHMEDAIHAGLIRDTDGSLIRFFTDDKGDVYVHQQDLIDNNLLNDYVGVEITQGGNDATQ